ncbi:hypothetical protein CCM_03665 [Cordyceps militaris CM01]|uniref:Uncharacterized protein n=2 Tax=Cordyceps militaris TaxID=73501 RepID=G3JFR1_CORMM|nr:uncharacterized protein CCM_03665 [Cordyceps militaris CM01]ATY66931.1 kinase domain-containing [Cordyceps militaris]EGX92294.1 hypothetical protein CCM_03665 [Cordyceps militaris CM01]
MNSTTGLKQAHANDDAMTAGKESTATKWAQFALGDGDCQLEINRTIEAQGKRRRIPTDTAGEAETADNATGLEETKRPGHDARLGDTGAVDERGSKEKEHDNLVIKYLNDTRRDSRLTQVAVKEWMIVNGLRPRWAYRTGYLRNDVRVRRYDGEFLWSVRLEDAGHKAMVELEGIFSAKGKPCVAYVRMDRVRRTKKLQLEGGQDEQKDEDDMYLRRVLVGLGLQQDKQALAEREPCTAARSVYLVVVPRGTPSVLRLYSGSVSRRMLNQAAGKRAGERLGLRRQALLRPDHNSPPAGSVRGVDLGYEEIDLTEVNAAGALFRGFFVKHGLVARSTPSGQERITSSTTE